MDALASTILSLLSFPSLSSLVIFQSNGSLFGESKQWRTEFPSPEEGQIRGGTSKDRLISQPIFLAIYLGPLTLTSHLSTHSYARWPRLIDTHKRRVFGLFFLVLETGSAVLDGIGKGKSDLLLAAFVLSTISFLITLCAYIKGRARSTSTIEVPAVSQLRVVELVFSSVQLIASLLQLLLAQLKEKKILDLKNNIDASVFPVAFAMVAVTFIFKNDEAITNSSREGFHQQPVELDLSRTFPSNQDSPSISLDIMPESFFDTLLPHLQAHNDTSSNMEGTLALGSPQRHMHPVEDFTALINSNESNSSTLIELDRVDSLTENQVHPMNFLRMRTNVTSKMKLSAPQIIQHGFSCSFEDEDAVNNHEKEEDYMNVSQILEVYMEDTNVKKPVDLLKLTGYKDLYKKVREMFNIEVEYLQDSKWILVYEDKGCGRLFNLGDFPWLEFTDHATKIYIHERDQLGISTKME